MFYEYITYYFFYYLYYNYIDLFFNFFLEITIYFNCYFGSRFSLANNIANAYTAWRLANSGAWGVALPRSSLSSGEGVPLSAFLGRGWLALSAPGFAASADGPWHCFAGGSRGCSSYRPNRLCHGNHPNQCKPNMRLSPGSNFLPLAGGSVGISPKPCRQHGHHPQPRKTFLLALVFGLRPLLAFHGGQLDSCTPSNEPPGARGCAVDAERGPTGRGNQPRA